MTLVAPASSATAQAGQRRAQRTATIVLLSACMVLAVIGFEQLWRSAFPEPALRLSRTAQLLAVTPGPDHAAAQVPAALLADAVDASPVPDLVARRGGETFTAWLTLPPLIWDGAAASRILYLEVIDFGRAQLQAFERSGAPIAARVDSASWRVIELTPAQLAAGLVIAVRAHGTIQPSLRLFTETGWARYNQLLYARGAVYLGIAFVLALVNFALALAFRDPAPAWYGVFASTAGLAAALASGVAFPVLFGFGPDPRAGGTIELCIMLASLSCIPLTRRALGTRRHAPRVDGCLLLVAWTNLGLIALAPIRPLLFEVLVPYVVMLVVLTMAVIAGLAWRRGAVLALPFLLGWSVLAVSVTPASMIAIGLLDGQAVAFGRIGLLSALMILGQTSVMAVFGLRSDAVSATARRESLERTRQEAVEQRERWLSEEITRQLRTLRQTYADLVEERAAVQRVLSMLKHDAANALNALMARADAARSVRRRDPERAAVLVNDMRAILRRLDRNGAAWLRALGGPVRPEDRVTVEVAGLVRGLLRQHGDGGPDRLDLRLRPARLRTNAAYLESVLANLVDNAFRHGSADGRIRIAVVRRGEHVVFQITNRLTDGRGLRSSSGSNHGSSGRGQGVGLSMTRSLVQQLGGHLRERIHGHAVSFRLALPVQEAQRP